MVALPRQSRYITSPAPTVLTFLTGVAKNPIPFRTQGFIPGQMAQIRSITASISLYQAKHPGTADVTRHAKFIKEAAGEENFTLPATMLAIPGHADANAAVGTNIAAPSTPANVMNIIVLIDGVVATRRGQDVADGALSAGHFKASGADTIRVHAPAGAEVTVMIPEQQQVTGGALTQHRTYETELWSFGFALGTVDITDAIAR